jgi:hypothetical protein
VVFHLGEKDHVAGLQIFRAQGIRDEVDAFGRAAREEFRRAAGIEELRQGGAAS